MDKQASDQFRAERVFRVVEGATPVRLPDGLHTVLHVMPDSAFETRVPLDVAALSDAHRRHKLQPAYSSSAYDTQRNSDGYLIHSALDQVGTSGSYLQLFRNGVFESVNTIAHRDPSGPQKLRSLESERQLLTSLPRYFAALESLGARAPIALALSLVGTFGYSMEVPPAAASSYGPCRNRFENDYLFPPEVVAETFACDFEKLLKPVFDAIWKEAGWAGSIYYEGFEWVGLARAFPE